MLSLNKYGSTNLLKRTIHTNFVTLIIHMILVGGKTLSKKKGRYK